MSPRPRVAAVSFLNTKPLIEGLERDVDLYLDVPSRLITGLRDGSFDVALLPVADIPTLPGATIIANAGGTHGGGIACEGPTLTVRIFSDRPLASITTLLCDTDSHTSVNLARVILRERYGVTPHLRPLPRNAAPDGPCLLIGDKVISAPPPEPLRAFEADLGAEWHALTGLPFVFAAWTARPGFDATPVAPLLSAALTSGLARLPQLAAEYAPPRHWPVDTALSYFANVLRYPLADRELQAVRLFWLKAGLTPA